MKFLKSKKGSATVVIIMLSVLFMLYASSTYADVRHMKNSYDSYLNGITNEYNKKYYEMVDIL